MAATSVPRPNTAAHAKTTNKWIVLAMVALGVFMATLDTSIVNISLPAIAKYFGAGVGGAVEWVVIAYLVVIAALLLSAGRLADLVGRKPIWIVGLVAFTAGSAMCGAAPSLPLLVTFRALQGIGGALVMAISPAMLTAAFPAKERGRALGLNAVAVALGVSCGPTLGGVLTERLSWRWIFYVNLPLGVLAAALSWKLLERDRPQGGGRFDPLGAALLTIGLASLTGALSFAPEVGWGSPFVVAGLAIAVVSLIAMVLWERRHPQPVLDLSLFRDRVFASALASLVLSFLAMFAVSFLLPFYLEELRGFDTEKAGLLLTPMPLTIAIVSPISGALADRIGTRWLAAGGLATACVGLVLVSRFDASTSIGSIVIAMIVSGAGASLFQPPNNSALMGAAPKDRQGVASGVLATGRVVGQSVSVALAGAIFAALGGSRAGHALRDHAGDAKLEGTFVHAFSTAFVVCACVAAVGIGASLVRGREGRDGGGGNRYPRSS